MVRRIGEPVIQAALRQGMRVLARQFVMGRTIEEALARATTATAQRWRYSFDMLGEAARTRDDAARYMHAYQDAIGAVGRAGGGPVNGPGISVKLSALHPRYEPLQARNCVPELIASLTALARAAKQADIGLTVDAEEADRLEISLDIFAAVLADPGLRNWDGLGLAVQAYQKRALPLIDWIAALARKTGHRVPVRLVKGAYWDTEIKLAQVMGYEGYPVFTRKSATDVSWIACALRLLERRDVLRPAFATHNAHSLAVILEAAGDTNFEMQRLHGMGEPLYDRLVGTTCPVRVYAPVGSHEDLLAYLVRRLLENGANTSFVHRLVDPAVPEDAIIADPVAALRELGVTPSPRIPLPSALYPDRMNSAGLDLADRAKAPEVLAAVRETRVPRRLPGSGPERQIRDPADHRRLIGTARGRDLDRHRCSTDPTVTWLAPMGRGWRDTPGRSPRLRGRSERGRTTGTTVSAGARGRPNARRRHQPRFASRLTFAAGYAARAREHFVAPRELSGPTGERNTWSLGGRGVFACISPWNFPLSIFVGQITAALAAGNAVAAKPAEQTPLIAARAIELLHQAGVPHDVLALLPGDGAIGAAIVTDPRIAGVAFTGGTGTARSIALNLASRPGPIVPFIAETGGINAMIVDSSALPEQVVTDVLSSAFGSTGQRCSSLRLLCLQEDVADRILTMLRGAAEMLVIGDPLEPATDVGPVIDQEALAALNEYDNAMGPALFELKLPAGTEHGGFFAPRAFLLPNAGALLREVFGPILHIVRYQADRLDALLDDIAGTGFGLTLGIHSRIETMQRSIIGRLRVGNAYVNRNQIGAVVGVQPFGGRGLSGTGPKAGGPITLFRFAEERVVSVNTTAAVGNAALLGDDQT